jgi:hypothetical protein
VEHIHFLDSLNFIPMSLKSMPKSFDLTFKKRYSPRSEGIVLDKAPISKNAGQRSLAKFKLNSIWRKWAPKQIKSQTRLVFSEKEFYEILRSPDIEVTKLIFPNDDVVWVSWKHSDENLPTAKNINVAVAGYVTTQSRFRLHEYMRDFDESVLYYDTDS